MKYVPFCLKHNIHKIQLNWEISTLRNPTEHNRKIMLPYFSIPFGDHVKQVHSSGASDPLSEFLLISVYWQEEWTDSVGAL